MTGIAGSRWIYPVLQQAAEEGVPDAAKAAYTIIQQTTYPSYGRWAVGLNWTSLGEYWEASSRTRNHHMFGSVGQWFYEGLAGLAPTKAGYEEIAFKPLIAEDAGIKHASASYKSVRGTVKSAWRKTAGGIQLDVTVPPGSTGRVYVPGSDPSKVGEVGSGTPLVASARTRRVVGRRDRRPCRLRGRLRLLRVPRRPGRVRGDLGGRDRRRHRAGDALVVARRTRLVRPVHTGRGEGVHGVDVRDRHLDRG